MATQTAGAGASALSRAKNLFRRTPEPEAAGQSKPLLRRLTGRDGDADALDPSMDADPRIAIDRALRYTRGGTMFDQKPVMREIHRALGALEQATLTIDAIREPLREAYNAAQTASEIEDQQAIHLLAQQYDQCMTDINERASAATHENLNLINGTSQNYEVPLDPEGKGRLVIGHANLTTAEGGLDLPFSSDVFISRTSLEKLTGHLHTALGRLDWMASIYCRDANVLVEHYKALARKNDGLD
ncbi:MAG: hypothetical protein AAGF19_05090 [Pseudomonadota bacterium]